MFFTEVAEATKIKDTNFKNHYPFINANTNWSPIKTAVNQSIYLYVKAYIGDALYNDLQTKFDAGTLNDNETELVSMLNDAIAHYAIWQASPHLNLTISDMGMMQQSDSKGTASAVDAWRYKHHHWMVMKRADEMLDKAIQFILKNLTTFFLYNTSSELFKKTLINNLTSYETYVSLNGSFRTFLKLIPFIRKAEKRYLLSVLGSNQLNDLHTKIEAGTLTDNDILLLEKCQSVVTEASLMLALPQLSIILDQGNAFMVSSMDGMNTKQVRHDAAITDMRGQLEEDLDLAINQLKSFLFVNVDNYPLYKASPFYTKYNNDDDEYAARKLDLGAKHGGVFMPDLLD